MLRENFAELARLTHTYLEPPGARPADRPVPVPPEDWPPHARHGAEAALRRMLRETLAWPMGLPLGGARSEPRFYLASDGNLALAFVVRLHLPQEEDAWSADADPEGEGHVLLLTSRGRLKNQEVDRDAGEDAAWTVVLDLGSLADPVLRGPTRPPSPRPWWVSNHHTEPLLRRLIAELEAFLEAPGAYGTPESVLAWEIQDCIHAHHRVEDEGDRWEDEIAGGTMAQVGLYRWRVWCGTHRTERDGDRPYCAEVSWNPGTGRILVAFEASSTGSWGSGIHVLGS